MSESDMREHDRLPGFRFAHPGYVCWRVSARRSLEKQAKVDFIPITTIVEKTHGAVAKP